MDADERRSRLGTLTLGAAGVFACAAALLTGPLAVACGILSGIALVTGLATAFAPELGMNGMRPPQEAAPVPPAEPQPSIRLHVDTPPSVRRWLERVEAEAEAAKRGR